MRFDPARLIEAALLGIGIAPAHHQVTWHSHWRLEKRLGDWSHADVAAGLAGQPYEVLERDGNLLMTVGATDLWNGLVTAGLATPWNSTNAMLAVGDGSTAPAVGNTDLAAAVGSTMNSGDISAATNATPIVLTVPSWGTTPVVGQTVVVAGVLGNTNANGTWEVQAVTSTTLTLLNSAGSGSFSTSAGSTVKPINKYRQLVSGAPVVTTNQVVFAATFGANNANFQWNEWAVTLGGATANKQASPPAKVLNRAVPGTNLGTKTNAGSWTLTVTLSLS